MIVLTRITIQINPVSDKLAKKNKFNIEGEKGKERRGPFPHL